MRVRGMVEPRVQELDPLVGARADGAPRDARRHEAAAILVEAGQGVQRAEDVGSIDVGVGGFEALANLEHLHGQTCRWGSGPRVLAAGRRKALFCRSISPMDLTRRMFLMLSGAAGMRASLKGQRSAYTLEPDPAGKTLKDPAGRVVLSYLTSKPEGVPLAGNSVCCIHPFNTPAASGPPTSRRPTIAITAGSSSRGTT